MNCPACQSPLGVYDEVCPQCGTPRPALPPRFAEARRRFLVLRQQVDAGHLGDEAFDAALADLVIRDGDGQTWMLGAESGDWYRAEGTTWIRTNPPTPGGSASSARTNVPDRRGDRGLRAALAVIGCNGLAVVLSVLLLGAVWLAGRSGPRPAATSSPDVPSAGRVRLTPNPPVAEPKPTLLTDQPGLVPEPTETSPGAAQAPVTMTMPDLPFTIRAYDPARDSGTGSLIETFSDDARQAYAEAGMQPGETSWYTVVGEGEPIRLSIGWCAADATALESNWDQMDYELEIDGIAIDLAWLAVDDRLDGDRYCRTFQGVLSGWTLGPHTITVRQHVYAALDDGWDLYTAGDYVRRWEVDIVPRYKADFGDASAWRTLDEANVASWPEGDAYHIVVHHENWLTTALLLEQDYDDVYLAATVTHVGGPAGCYGLAFRAQDNDNFYLFAVSDEGTYVLRKQVDGGWADIVPYTYAEAIRQGGEANKLWVVAEQASLSLYANGEWLITVTDDAFRSGGFGLAVQSLDAPEVHAAFSHFWAEGIPNDIVP
ncbi:MAG: hypothetical protein JXC32_17150 [Anaerolineae bacterium]|nr:hypothetical protein [Anaerolineae bacterium]